MGFEWNYNGRIPVGLAFRSGSSENFGEVLQAGWPELYATCVSSLSLSAPPGWRTF
jgi:hypothetical protein